MLSSFENVYFIGIGGIGMSALARWFHAKKYQVAGFDRKETDLTRNLQEEGIPIHYQEDITQIPPTFFNPSKTLVVYTPAVQKEHLEYQYFTQEKYTVLKRSEVLGMITKDHFTIAVAGTHGKTSTSSMIAHILQYSEIPVTAFLGGILRNYSTNLLLNTDINQKEIIVVEADEYDRSFLTLDPDIAVITYIEPDHLDIYEDKTQFAEAFGLFAQKIKDSGLLITKPFIQDALAAYTNKIEHKSYSIEEKSDFQAINIDNKEGLYHFDVAHEGELYHFTLQTPGRHNVENATAAIAASLQLNIEYAKIQAALYTFQGAKRRFEYIFRSKHKTYIDDYAHHPTEIKSLLETARSLYPNQKITIIFQPHLFTRTRDFAEDFASSLSLADEVILLDIYPARELPIEGVDSEMLLKKVSSPVKHHAQKENIIELLNSIDIDILITAGAGDIDGLIPDIKSLMDAE